MHTIAGIQAALAYDNREDARAARLQKMLREDGLDAVLREVCGLEPADELYSRIRDVMA
jgi:mannitol-1-phosphate 5-dehydrogenase